MILPFAQRAGVFAGLALLSLTSVTALHGIPSVAAQQFSARTELVEVYATVTDDGAGS